MKRSAKVALTLLVPAMTAFGCGQSTATVNSPAQHSAQDCDVPAKPGEPPKPKCTPTTTASHGSHYGSSRGSWFGPIFGSSHSGSSASHGSTSSSHVSHGGFGSSGSHFSGGS